MDVCIWMRKSRKEVLICEGEREGVYLSPYIRVSN
jgi:hypothetical protein